RLVAVRMVLADHVTDDTRRLVIGLVAVRAEFVHGVQHAPVHRLQAIADVRQRAPHDHAHRVIQVAAPHFVVEVDRDDFLREIGHRIACVLWCRGSPWLQSSGPETWRRSRWAPPESLPEYYHDGHFFSSRSSGKTITCVIAEGDSGSAGRAAASGTPGRGRS